MRYGWACVPMCPRRKTLPSIGPKLPVQISPWRRSASFHSRPRKAVGDHGRRDGRRVDGVGSRPELDAEFGEPGPALGRYGFVAGKRGVHAFLEDGLRPRVQRGHPVPVRGIGAASVRAHGAEGQDGVVALIVHLLHAFPRGAADAHHAHARGAAQALLGTAEHQVDVPFVHVHGRSAEPRHRVHIEQRHAEILLELAEQPMGFRVPDGVSQCTAVSMTGLTRRMASSTAARSLSRMLQS